MKRLVLRNLTENQTFFVSGSVANSAFLRLTRKLKANPGFTKAHSPLNPRLGTSQVRRIFLYDFVNEAVCTLFKATNDLFRRKTYKNASEDLI